MSLTSLDSLLRETREMPADDQIPCRLLAGRNLKSIWNHYHLHVSSALDHRQPHLRPKIHRGFWRKIHSLRRYAQNNLQESCENS
jgi:hypothetical protein